MTFSLALAGMTACESTPQVPANELDSPEKLQRAILDRAEHQDYDGVRELVYPAPVVYPAPAPPGLTTQDCVVEVMRQDRGPGYTGDFAYSAEALRAILDSHMHRFTSRISPHWLRPASDGGLLDDDLIRRTNGGDAARFRLFDHQGCHILLVELDGEYKLIFWEGMNKLLREQSDHPTIRTTRPGSP
jgi:hypothetical protein